MTNGKGVTEMSDVRSENHSEEVKEALRAAKKRAAEIIGMKAETYMKLGCPVDTGRLRNSLTYATQERSGFQNSYSDNNGNAFFEYVGSVPEDDFNIYIGTNVEYAMPVESRNHFIHSAAADHGDEYKSVIENELKNA